jgi:hypothetical protein
VQARQRNLVDINKVLEDLREAGEYIMFALDKRPALWKIYDKKNLTLNLWVSGWARRSHLAQRKPLYHPLDL